MRLFVLCFCFSISIWSLQAQSSDISPYSRYGIGDLHNQVGVQGFSMGQTGIATHNDTYTPFFINLKNPASYSYYYIKPFDTLDNKNILKIACFEAGVLNNRVTLASGDVTHYDNNTYFGYFALAFPMSKHFGGCLGLVPLSTVGYNIITTSVDNNIGTYFNQYTGSGGVNKAFIGLSYAPIKNISMGANLTYLFGNIANTENVFLGANLQAFDSQKKENVHISDFRLDYGVMATINLPKDWNLTLGATAALATDIDASYNLLSLSFLNLSTQVNVDTIQDTSYNGRIRLPMMIGGGITLKKGDKWTFAFDYTAENWNQFQYITSAASLSNSYQMGFGAQYIPHKNFDAPRTFFQRIHYRAGAAFTQTYLDLNNTPLKDYCVTAGLGIPIGGNIIGLRASILNAGVQVGQFGTTSNNLIKQTYVKFMLGFTFNDRWFAKNLYQ